VGENRRISAKCQDSRLYYIPSCDVPDEW
jgi:hypothetical protein